MDKIWILKSKSLRTHSYYIGNKIKFDSPSPVGIELSEATTFVKDEAMNFCFDHRMFRLEKFTADEYAKALLNG